MPAQDKKAAMLRRALMDRRRELGAHHQRTLTAARLLLQHLVSTQNNDEADALAHEFGMDLVVRDIATNRVESTGVFRRPLAAGSAVRAQQLGNQCNDIVLTNSHLQASVQLRGLLAVAREELGATHHVTCAVLANLARALSHLGGHEGEVTSLYQERLAALQGARSPQHIDVLSAMIDLANALYHQERYEDAEPLLRRRLEAGPPCPAAQRLLGFTLARTGKWAEATRLLSHPDLADDPEALAFLAGASLDASMYPELLRHGAALLQLGSAADKQFATACMMAALVGQEQFDRAEALLQGGIMHGLPTLQPMALKTMSQVATKLLDCGQLRLCKTVTQAVLASGGPRSTLFQHVGHAHVDASFGLGDCPALEVAEMCRVALDGGHVRGPGALRVAVLLAQALDAQGARAEANKWYRGALVTQLDTLGQAHPDTQATLLVLARRQAADGKLEQAESLLRKVHGCTDAWMHAWGHGHERDGLPRSLSCARADHGA